MIIFTQIRVFLSLKDKADEKKIQKSKNSKFEIRFDRNKY